MLVPKLTVVRVLVSVLVPFWPNPAAERVGLCPVSVSIAPTLPTEGERCED